MVNAARQGEADPRSQTQPAAVPVAGTSQAKQAAADRVFVGLLYRAMRMIAAAVQTRYGIVIRVEMPTVDGIGNLV